MRVVGTARGSRRIIDAISESVIGGDVAVVGSGDALTFGISHNPPHSDGSV